MSSIFQDLKQQYKVGDMATKLIFWNSFLFIVPSLIAVVLYLVNIPFDYKDYVAVPSLWSLFVLKPWTLVSYSFFHNSVLHLIFNMMMLHFSGRLFTTFFTQKQLFGLYFLGGLFGGLLFLLGYQSIPSLQGQSTALIGASASVMAILVATTVYQPDYNLRLLFFGNVKLWHVALVFLILDVIQLPFDNTGGHIAHLGGALFGFVYIQFLKSGIDLTSGLNSFLDTLMSLFSKKKTTPFKKVHRNVKPKSQPSGSRIVTKDKTQQQIDEILDKISQSGYDSLTKEEKEFLFKAGK
ncbi:rhomboid family intramembrane serine protease [Flavobacterium luminosum]|uniref:Rhomboid family intramembrane serine protease n=1 Tax=Flavobacterium luminosum TaxID=2949086 RepID=A0ABT0TKB0_9FLAO|nr:rhomboid family intramembrane serine protease [Flavobacterium sp. HXWNR70]MCL9807765.1 rhomboid family intramembrane serine protease [Flavobacterium sp. HXWNR70]